MLDRLKPLTLGEAARRIGVDPFEVVRLLVQRGESESLRVPQSKVDELRAYAGVEVWWTPQIELVDDVQPQRAQVRTALRMLLERGHIGDDALTRVDNLWRGLPLKDQAVVDAAVEALAEQGLLKLMRTERGLHVAVRDKDAATALQAAVDSGSFASPVARVWEDG